MLFEVSSVYNPLSIPRVNCTQLNGAFTEGDTREYPAYETDGFTEVSSKMTYTVVTVSSMVVREAAA